MRSHRLRAAAGNSDGSVVLDFTQGSAPSGTTTSYGSDSTTLSWANSNLNISGDAGNNSYRLRLNKIFEGDYLFQLSTRLDDTTSGSFCNDAGLALFTAVTHNDTTGNWDWAWSASAGRLAVQNNCPQPYIYGQSGQYAGTANVLKPTSSGGSSNVGSYPSWITMNVRYLPSQTKIQYSVRAGKNDWTESGGVIQSTFELNERFSQAGALGYYVGVSADFDNGTTLFSALRYKAL